MGDMILSAQDGTLTPLYPIPPFNQGTATAAKNTGGFTVFAEGLPKPPGPNDGNDYPVPPAVNFTRDGRECGRQAATTTRPARYFCDLVVQAGTGNDPNQGSPGLIVKLENGEDSTLSIVAGVLHWAFTGGGRTRLFFWDSDLLDINLVRSVLKPGGTIKVKYYEPGVPGKDGKTEEDNLAFGHVHGGHGSMFGSGGYPRIRYGAAGRDFNVYTVNDIPSNFVQGSSYYYRQYFMMDKYTEMQAKGLAWRNQAAKAVKSNGSIAGRTVTLYSDAISNTFGHTVGSDSCRQPGASAVCVGSTTPPSNTNWKPVFEIYCGDDYVVTDNLYHFTPAWNSGGTIRSYVCDGKPGVRPVWTLLGFFDVGACSGIGSNYQYDATYC